MTKIVGHDSVELGIWVNLDDRAKFLRIFSATVRLTEVECQLRSQRGTIHTMLLSADLIEINREPHLLVFGVDITQRKQAEAELLRTLAREKELGQLRSKFVSMVSHEFRTPLAIIQSSAEILDDYLDQLEPAERKRPSAIYPQKHAPNGHSDGRNPAHRKLRRRQDRIQARAAGVASVRAKTGGRSPFGN